MGQGAKLGATAGSQTRGGPEGQSEYFETYSIGRSMKGSVGGTRQTERWKPAPEHTASLRCTGQHWKDRKRRGQSRTGQGWCEVAGVETGKRH